MQKSHTNLIMHRVKEYTLKGIVEATKENPGESVFSESWNQLIILDDCRYDVFENEFKNRRFPGKLVPKLSLGSWTGEFLVKNFNKKLYSDIIFISANPFVDKYLKGKFYKIIPVWKTHWNERYNTVPPRAVCETAIDVAKRYPHKRLIIHFLQPHQPYFTLGFDDRAMGAIKNSVETGGAYLHDFPSEPLYEIYLSEIYAYFPVQRLIRSYRENLRIVLPYVELLLHYLGGKSVITSDHGELFGETVTRLLPIKVYGHGIGRNPNLIRVPWWVVEDEDRENLRPVKEIVKEIAKIEKRFSLRSEENEIIRLKRAILKFKKLNRSGRL